MSSPEDTNRVKMLAVIRAGFAFEFVPWPYSRGTRKALGLANFRLPGHFPFVTFSRDGITENGPGTKVPKKLPIGT